jgi:hypothetical protein
MVRPLHHAKEYATESAWQRTESTWLLSLQAGGFSQIVSAVRQRERPPSRYRRREKANWCVMIAEVQAHPSDLYLATSTLGKQLSFTQLVESSTS